jgi:large repetitive protein
VAGSYSFTVTATDSNGYTGSQALTFAIGESDPTQEKDFRAVLGNEVSVIRRFTGTQITNVARRLEELHDGTESASQLCISTTPAPRPGEFTDDNRQIPEVCPESRPGAKALIGVSAWMSGTLEYGNLTATPTLSSSRFSTKGITLGADYRMPDNRVVGIALGYGFDDITVGESGSDVRAQNLNLIGYGGWKPYPNIFVDVLTGLGNTILDTQRRADLDNSLASGERTANGIFGAFIASAGLNAQPFQVTTYFRTDYLNARLASYQETGATSQALAYDATTLQSSSVTFGVRASYPLMLAGGKFEPGVRVEYQSRYDDAVKQVVHYVDTPSGPAYSYTLPGTRQQIAALGLSARYVITRLAVARIEFQIQYSDGAVLSHGVRGNVAVSF